MTRLLVVADVHLGSHPAYGRTPFSRLADQTNAWQATCEAAVTRGVDGVLVAGDLFDRSKPSPGEYLAAIRGLRWLSTAGIPCLMIPGNHDLNGASDEACALDVLEQWAIIARRPGVHDVGGAPVAVLPWASKARMAAQLDGSEVDAPSTTVAERLVDIAAVLRTEASILLAHWSLSGAVTSTGMVTDEFREPTLSVPALHAQAWRYVLAGHVHKRQDLGGGVAYVGSLCVCDFAEADEPHGFAIIDTDSADLEPEWVEVEQRRFVTITCDLTREPPQYRAAEPLGAFFTGMAGSIADEIHEHTETPMCETYFEDAVVRVRYECTEEQRRRVDHRDIEAALYEAGAHRVYSIEATVQRETRARVGKAQASLAPAEGLNLWIEYQAIEPPRAERMRVEAAAYEVAS